jgi:hypothetical protein
MSLDRGGVSPERIQELSTRTRRRAVTLKGDDLAKIEGLVLRTGRKSSNRLVPRDPAEKRQFDIGEVRRLEVVSRE